MYIIAFCMVCTIILYLQILIKLVFGFQRYWRLLHLIVTWTEIRALTWKLTFWTFTWIEPRPGQRHWPGPWLGLPLDLKSGLDLNLDWNIVIILDIDHLDLDLYTWPWHGLNLNQHQNLTWIGSWPRPDLEHRPEHWLSGQWHVWLLVKSRPCR